MPQVSDYTALIPPANASKPNFMAIVSLYAQAAVDATTFFESLVSGNFNVATAVGPQLDIIGQWVGISRYVSILLNQWFSFDTANLGFDQGVWWVPPEPQSGVMALDDTTYRALIAAKIAWNNWDATTPSYFTMLATLFSPCTVAITDNLNKTIGVTVTGTLPNPTLKLLATESMLPFVPVGVAVSYTFVA